MGAELFWLLSFWGVAAMALVCGLLAWPQLSAAWPSIEARIDRFRRQPPLAKVVVLVFIVGFIAYGSTKTNQVDGVGLGLRSRSTMEDNVLCMTSDYDFPHPSVSPADIARGWQLWEVKTNCNISYAMPESAAFATNWWVRGAHEDVNQFDFGEWRFPFGSNGYSSVWALTWGKLRFALADTNTEIVAVGAPMSAVPYRSRLWSAADTNGSRLVTWENFALNRDTNTPVNAQIELRTTGDFITRSNEVESVYRYIDDFDWDGDGIPNWNDWAPYWYDGDYAGQEDWWREYVDECVGMGLENGSYKLTATFPREGFRRTVLTVGFEEIVIAEPGEYVFLLEKGNEYEIVLEPIVDGVLFDAVDDIPEGNGLAMPLMVARGHWEGKWTKDEGRLYLTLPQPDVPGCVMWTPKLCVSPGEWSPSAGDPSENFTAVLFDGSGWMTDQTYHWTSGNNTVTFGSPMAAGTLATWSMASLEDISARLTVSFGQYELVSALSFHFEEESDRVPNASFRIEDMPDTLFVNNDNDLGHPEPDYCYPLSADDDMPFATLRLCSTVLTSGTIRVENMTGFVGDVYSIDDGTCHLVYEGRTWTVDNETDWSRDIFFNAYGKSGGFESSQIKFRWTPDVGMEKTLVRRFTVVEPVVEPVCEEVKPVTADGETVNLVYNPCGVAVGRDAYFKIKAKPDAYPDSMIEWEASGDGAVSFVGASCGREVCVRGVSPGDVTLSAKFGTCVSSPPSFTFRVVTNRTVRLSAWIVENKNLEAVASTVERVNAMVKAANDIYAQVGVTFDLGDRIAITNIPAAYDINEEGAANGRWDIGRLADLASSTGGLECYFVNSITRIRDDGSTAALLGLHVDSGLAVAASAGGVILAHELGHAFGMSDIYCESDGGSQMSELTRGAYWLGDWNGGCNSHLGWHGTERYYGTGTEHHVLVRRMLMDGRKADPSRGLDITYGGVFGFGTDDSQDDRDTGFFSPPREGDPIHR